MLLTRADILRTRAEPFVIVVCNAAEAKRIGTVVGKDYVLTMSQVREHGLRGRDMRRTQVLVDNLDLILPSMFGGHDVNLATISPDDPWVLLQPRRPII